MGPAGVFPAIYSQLVPESVCAVQVFAFVGTLASFSPSTRLPECKKTRQSPPLSICHAHTHTHRHSHTRIHMHLHKGTHIHTASHTEQKGNQHRLQSKHTPTHTCTRIHTHSHTHTQPPATALHAADT